MQALRSIAVERARQGISQGQLAKEIEVNPATIANWEKGKTSPSGAQLIILARFFGVSVDYLLGLGNNQ